MTKFWLVAVAALVWMMGATPRPWLPTPTPTPVVLPQPAGSWVYPNSTRQDANRWKSGDDPGVITNWYKNKIEALGMNTKSFVQTNTNGQVLNKLVAANDNIKVSVEISKSPSDSQALILVVPFK